MRALLALALAAGLPLTGPAARETGPARRAPAADVDARAERVHYFVDSGCTDCSPDDELEPGDYWVVTAAVHSGPRRQLQEVAEEYRQALRRQFDRPDAVAGNVVVRFRDTAEAARAGRLDKIDRMRRRGYRILEVELRTDAGVRGTGGTGRARERWVRCSVFG